MTIQIWYHGNCDDGFGSAWAVSRWFRKHEPLMDINYVPCFYGKEPPPVKKEDIIYIVDFSYPRPILEQIKDCVTRLTILDHHKTAQEDLKGFPNAIFDMDRSGAVITWSYFHSQSVPLLLRYVQDNDLWTHKLQAAKAVTRYIRTVPHAFEAWDKLHDDFETDMSGIVKKAKAIEKYFQNQIEFNSVIAQVINCDGHTCPVINCNTTFISEMCHLLHEKHQTEIAASFFIDQDSKVIFSLRSAGRIDVSAIAKKFGGGGHHNAAGFKCSLDNLHRILSSKEFQA